MGRLYRKKPVEVEAVRYGLTYTGEWDPQAVRRVVVFMLNMHPDSIVSDVTATRVVQPTIIWDPPENSDLVMWGGKEAKIWFPLALGDWVIKDVNGEFTPCKDEIFKETYEEIFEVGND